ncbi:MAG: Nif3-like dinuclear metal center hexameric protein [Ignavibacteriota bacterium]
MKIADFLSAFNEVIPLAAIGYAKDAVGLQVGYGQGSEVTKILLAYEVTNEVIDEAIGAGANLIVSYHPLIFPNIGSVTDATRTGSLLRRLIKNDLALYVIHTALDSHPEYGTSRLMANELGLTDIRILMPLPEVLEKIVVFVPKPSVDAVREAMWEAGAGNISNYDECSFMSEGLGSFRGNEQSRPAIGKPLSRETVDEIRVEMIVEKWKAQNVIKKMIAAHPYEEVAYDKYSLANSHPKFGMGSIGKWSTPLSADAVLRLISQTFGTPALRYNSTMKTEFSSAATLGGSGMDFYSKSKSQGAEIFITGDIHYHDFHKAEHDGVLLVDAGHAETERFVTDGMLKAVQAACNVVNLYDELPQSLIIQSAVSPNVVRYYQ